jgi:hypothetical protein
MAKTLDFASALVALTSSDLTSVSGGLFGSGSSTSTTTTNNTNTSGTTVAPNLTCPEGTSPQWRRITGNLSGNVGTAGVGVTANGSGTFEEFNCVPTAPTITPTR